MKTMIKKFTTPIIALSLVLAYILQPTTVSGKYISIVSATKVWESIFEDITIADLFTIDNPTGDESGILWGANKDGSMSEDDYGYFGSGNFNAAKNIDSQFSVFNNTSEYMLIKFIITYTCDNARDIQFGISNTAINSTVNNDENLTNNRDYHIEGTTKGIRDSDTPAYTIIIARYYYYTATINPFDVADTDNEKNILVDAFVLESNELGNYDIFFDLATALGSTTSSAYASVKLIAVPCDADGREYAVDANGNFVLDDSGNRLYTDQLTT